ncbi:hypothetical protein [Streptomyces sp. NPDC008122]|uniref:hypothetical protein n=1 Tax=Streptomyces sp. NPDC008122 TaxID=3364810 RepID=UPI0036EAF5B9
MSEETALAYLQTADYGWTRRAFELLGTRALTVTPYEGGGAPCFVVEGPCPRCDHHLVDRQVTTGLTGMSGPSRGEGGNRAPAIVLDVTCGCGGAHENAPAGAVGCGASFRIVMDAV